MSASTLHDDKSVIRIGRIAAILQTVSAVLLVVLIGLYVSLYRNQDTLRDSVREDAIWAVYQLDRETRKLATALERYVHSADPTDAMLEEIILRYDILYSRLNILENAKYQDHFTDNPEVKRRIDDAATQILGFEPAFNAIVAGNVPTREKLDDIEDRFDSLVRATEDFLTFTNTTVSTQRAETRATLMQMGQATAGVVTILFIALLALIFTLRRQASSARAVAARAARVSSEVSRSWEAAEAGNRAKSQFMATIGHEIRTPLNAILGMAELLDAEDLPKDSAECVQVIHSSGNTLLEMLNEILDYSKIEHGKLEIEYRSVGIAELVDGALDIVCGRAQEKGLTLRADMPDSVARALYRTDPTRVRQVLINLLGNAVKFTHDGEIALSVAIMERGEGFCLHFEITDTGIGIDAEGRGKLFEPFSQVDSSISRRFGGTGLGLTICKHIVEALGGRIGMFPNDGRGSTFWFDIPAELAEDMPITEPHDAASEAALPPLRILLVEDNTFNCRVATRFLAKFGQTATIVENGLEAVELAAREKFDLILMDLQMPLMDGIEAVHAIRFGAGPNVDTMIVALTANASDEDRKRCFAVGFDGFESKPMTMERLRAVFDQVIARHMPPEAAPANGYSARLNASRRAEMIELFGEAEYEELLKSFRSEAETLLCALEAAGDGDPQIRDRLLHTLKGAALNVGLDDLAQEASELRASMRQVDEVAKLRERCNGVETEEKAA